MHTEFLKKIISEIKQKVEEKSNIIVAISGGSCTRKSSLVSTLLMDYFKDDAVLISQDQFQLQPSYVQKMHPDYKLDHPDNFGITTCYDALTKLLDNQVVNIPNYNFVKEEPISCKTITPAQIIFFEGLYTNYEKLQRLNDMSIYVKSPWYARLARRIFRNTLDRYKGIEANSIVQTFCDWVTEAHVDFVKNQEEASNFVLETPLQFENIIQYYNLKPMDSSATKHDNFFSLDCGNNVTFRIDRGTNLRQFEFLFFCKNQLYLKFNLTNNVANMLKNIDWLAY